MTDHHLENSLPAAQESQRKASEELMALVMRHTSCSDQVSEIKTLLDRGADVQHRSSPNGRTVLHQMMARGMTAAVEAVMEYPQLVVDLTAVDAAGRTPLHVLCLECKDEVAAQRMLHSVVLRFTNPEEMTEVDWRLEESEKGLDFINAAASNGRLSSFWMEVRHLNEYADLPNGDIELKVPVAPVDWDKLSEDSKEAFSIVN